MSKLKAGVIDKRSAEFIETIRSRYYLDEESGRLCSHFSKRVLDGWLLEPKVGQARYRCHKVYLNGKKLSVREHHLVWVLAHGEWPESEIDHKDRDGLNNRPGNLRLVTHAINGRNLPLLRNNKSGIAGVQWRPDFSRWVAQVKVRSGDKQKSIYLGSFETIFDAACARKSYEAANGFRCGDFQPEQQKAKEVEA